MNVRRNYVFAVIFCIQLLAVAVAASFWVRFVRAGHPSQAVTQITTTKLLKAATLSLQPDAASLGKGKSGALTLSLDSGGAAIDRIDVNLTYPADLVRITSLDLASSVCLAGTVNQTVKVGSISLSCAAQQPKVKSQLGTVMRIPYSTLQTGSASIRITSASSLMAGGEDILKHTQDSIITITP